MPDPFTDITLLTELGGGAATAGFTGALSGGALEAASAEAIAAGGLSAGEFGAAGALGGLDAASAGLGGLGVAGDASAGGFGVPGGTEAFPVSGDAISGAQPTGPAGTPPATPPTDAAAPGAAPGGAPVDAAPGGAPVDAAPGGASGGASGGALVDAAPVAPGTSFLGPNGVTGLSPQHLDALGITGDLGGGGFNTDAALSSFDASQVAPAAQGFNTDAALASFDASRGASGGGGFSDILKKLGISPAQAGLYGMSAVNALSKPKLPSALNTLQKNSATGSTQAQAVIGSGGTGTPIWAQQKAAIDASIEQQLQEQSQALRQSAGNQGMTGMVQEQQVNSLKQKLENQRQQLYLQAQQQNVQSAVAELTGNNQALGTVAQTQLGQSADARASASETARLAALLGQASNKKTTEPAVEEP